MDSKKDPYDLRFYRPADLAAVEAADTEEVRAHAINFAISRGLLEDSLAVRNYSVDELYDHVLQADSMETGRSEKSFGLSTYDDRLRDQFTEFARRPLNLNEYWSAPSGEGPKGGEWENKPHRLLYDLIGEVVRLTEHLREIAEVENEERVRV
jgi:hypothetical protein